MTITPASLFLPWGAPPMDLAYEGGNLPPIVCSTRHLSLMFFLRPKTFLSLSLPVRPLSTPPVLRSELACKPPLSCANCPLPP